MPNYEAPRRTQNMLAGLMPFINYYRDSPYARYHLEPDVCDFAFGNPQQMPLAPYVESLQRHLPPQHKDWFAYQDNWPASQEIMAGFIQEQLGASFDPQDILITTGAFAGLMISMLALSHPDDEIIFNSPPWFFYESMIHNAGAVPVRVKINMETFDLDLEAIEAAITPRTRAIIVNSPNNPTGKIYSPETLKALGEILERASERYGRRIFIISDEAYRQIVFDGRDCPSATAYYPFTILVYTFGKILLAPGQRLGFVALPPTMPDREPLQSALIGQQYITGFAIANALLQHSLPEIVRLSIDIGNLQQRRDRMQSELQRIGYDVHKPEGTFYLLPRSPIEDDVAFTEILGEDRILCLPGSVAEAPGYFRISLTASDEMVERSLPGFKRAFRKAHR
ncbi:MAG: aminotransferase class I/II-fold pyridoxal phosphate-dependent enzyme [Anaerolineales bacterium]|nr:aminotransferase class I/II-fold pyridoxal phosphate-dependent enzyme [Anaerolineales bacterium]